MKDENKILESDLSQTLKETMRKRFVNIKAGPDIFVPIGKDDTLELIEGTNISIIRDIEKRQMTFNLTGKVSSAIVADSANEVDWSGVANKPVDWIVNQGTNYSIYNSGRMDQWGMISLSKSWTYIAFPIQFINITNFGLSVVPVAVSASYTGGSPTYSIGVKNISKTGFYVISSTLANNTWRASFYAVAK